MDVGKKTDRKKRTMTFKMKIAKACRKKIDSGKFDESFERHTNGSEPLYNVFPATNANEYLNAFGSGEHIDQNID